MSAPSTSRLVHAWRTARPGSFTALYERVCPSLRVWAEVQVPSSLRAVIEPDELVQEVWVRAWREFERFDAARGRFRSWLFGIAYRVLRGELRAWRRRRRVNSIDTVPSDIAEHVTDIATRVSRKLDLTALHSALEGYEAMDRMIAVYRGLEGLPYREVAQRTGLSVDAAETRWRRMKPRLRRLAHRLGLL